MDWYAGFVVIVDDIGDWKLYDRNEERKTSISYFLGFLLLVIILVQEMFLFSAPSIFYIQLVDVMSVNY